MSQPPVTAVPAAPASAAAPHDAPLPDAVERIVPFIPVVIPVLGAIMMFLLATIAVYMA